MDSSFQAKLSDAIKFEPYHFRSSTITYNVTNHMIQLRMNGCAWIDFSG